MFEIVEKIVQKLQKLDNYYVLKHEKEHIIVGTKIIIIEYKIISQRYSFHTLTPNELNKDQFKKEFPVFFLITAAKKPMEIDKMFKIHKIPILNISDIKKGELRESLDKFVNDKILNVNDEMIL